MEIKRLIAALEKQEISVEYPYQPPEGKDRYFFQIQKPRILIGGEDMGMYVDALKTFSTQLDRVLAENIMLRKKFKEMALMAENL